MKANEKINDEINELAIGNNTTLSPTTEDELKGMKSFDLSIIPVSSHKTPYGKWKQYQSECAPYKQWREHYCNGGYVGIITGKVSGGLECIDIDLKNDPTGTIYEDYKKLIPEYLFQKLIIQTTPNDGFHLIYRCPDVSFTRKPYHHFIPKAYHFDTRLMFIFH